MKKLLLALLAVLLLTGCTSAPAAKTDEELMAEGWVKAPTEGETVVLPAPVDTTKMYTPSKDAAEEACADGIYAAACSAINSTNLTEYLNVEDALYIDLRDYNDYAKKHIRNFEVIPYFGLIFNAEANTNSELSHLYGGEITAPVSTFEESDDLLEAFFPKDKTLFLMCQSGGRVAQFMEILAAKGYDMSKVYNVGGMGQYTDASFADVTTNTEEMVVEATYKLDGLTRN